MSSPGRALELTPVTLEILLQDLRVLMIDSLMLGVLESAFADCMMQGALELDLLDPGVLLADLSSS